MSSTNRGEVREYDHYTTHPKLAKLVCSKINDDYGPFEKVIEPGCGEGSFLNAINEVMNPKYLYGVEKNEKLYNYSKENTNATVLNKDYLELEVPQKFDLAIGNPPFKLAQEFIEKSLKSAEQVAFLLRLNYLGGQRRYKNLWSEIYPKQVYVMPARPGFTPNGKTDSIEYMIAFFDNNWEKEKSILTHLDNRNIQNKWDSEEGYCVIEE